VPPLLPNQNNKPLPPEQATIDGLNQLQQLQQQDQEQDQEPPQGVSRQQRFDHKIDRWQQMPTEQKQKIQGKIQQRWQKSSPEEKSFINDHILMQWQSMSPRERQTLINLFKQNSFSTQ